MKITIRYFGYNESGLHSCAIYQGDISNNLGEYLEGTKKELTGKINQAIKKISKGKPIRMVSHKHQETIFQVE